MDRWFGHIDLYMAVLTLAMTACGVVAAYLTSLVWMYVILLMQGIVETILHLGKNYINEIIVIMTIIGIV